MNGSSSTLNIDSPGDQIVRHIQVCTRFSIISVFSLHWTGHMSWNSLDFGILPTSIETTIFLVSEGLAFLFSALHGCSFMIVLFCFILKLFIHLYVLLFF